VGIYIREKEMSELSLVDYYRKNDFNPVLIQVEDIPTWRKHFDKRRNLYENHLKIPLTLLGDKSVIEFGPNSGENALVLAVHRANLTLIEPNEKVIPRLKELFEKFGVKDTIKTLSNQTLESYQTHDKFRIAIAEGFLYTLPNRDKMLEKIAGWLLPGGFGIVSYNDRYGSLMEALRRFMLFKVCELEGIKDVHSEASLAVARRLFEEDFSLISSSRKFEAWWKDTLVNPLVSSKYLWSFEEMVKILERCDCLPYSTSPVWSTSDQYRWYKNLREPGHIKIKWMSDWIYSLRYFISGLAAIDTSTKSLGADTVCAVKDFVCALFDGAEQTPVKVPEYPEKIDLLLSSSNDVRLRLFNMELKTLLSLLGGTSVADILTCYRNTIFLRHSWGTPYHYLCFQREN